MFLAEPKFKCFLREKVDRNPEKSEVLAPGDEGEQVLGRPDGIPGATGDTIGGSKTIQLWKFKNRK